MALHKKKSMWKKYLIVSLFFVSCAAPNAVHRNYEDNLKELQIAICQQCQTTHDFICHPCTVDNYKNYISCSQRECTQCVKDCCSEKNDKCCCLHVDKCTCNPSRK